MIGTVLALVLAVVWLAAAVGVGVLIGKAIAEADRREAAQREAARPVYVPGTWVA